MTKENMYVGITIKTVFSTITFLTRVKWPQTNIRKPPVFVVGKGLTDHVSLAASLIILCV